MDSKIDSYSFIPYYQQLYTILKSRIQNNEWDPGQKFLSESQICSEYNVSRTVVRNTLDNLEDEGLISRRKGKGTFVLATKINEGLAQNLTGFYQDMSDRGHTITNRVLLQKIIPCPDNLSSILDIPLLTPVFQLERLRFVEGVPITLVTSYLPAHYCPSLANMDMSNRSLYEFLEKECNIQIARANRSIEATAADEKKAKLLGLKSGDPVIKLTSISYLDDGSPIEYYIAYHRGDRTKFEINLMRVREKWRMLNSFQSDELFMND
jgi:GntR family transcriptional regulator